MKKLLIFFLCLFYYLAGVGQIPKKMGAVSIPTYAWFRTPLDSGLQMYQGSALGYPAIRLLGDTSILKTGVATLWRLHYYMNRGDTTQNKYGYIPFYRYQFLRLKADTVLNTGTASIYQNSLKISKTAGGSSKFQMADGSVRDTVYQKHIPAGTTLQYWRGDKSWQTFPSGMTWPASGGIAIYSGSSSWGSSITDNHTNWDKYNQWDGGSTGLTAATGRASLEATTTGSNIFKIPDYSSIAFIKINADNTVTTEAAATHLISLGANTIGRSLFNLTNPSAITFLRLNADNSSTALNASDFRTAIGLNFIVQTLTVSAGAAPWDTSVGVNAKVTLSGAVTITLSNLPATYGIWGTLSVYNDATPRVLTFAGYTNKIDPAVRSGANQITTSGGSKEDIIGWYWNGSSLSWFAKFDIN